MMLKRIAGSGTRKSFGSKIITTILLFFFVYTDAAQCTCLDISDTPMITKNLSAPPIIMFVLDNSGSMDWEFMTNEADGLFNGSYYLYPNSAFIDDNQDIAYGTGDILPAGERTEWKSQWYGYNKIFYNPNTKYEPWPGMSNADTAEPWSNPNNTATGNSRFDMDGEYFSVLSGLPTEVIVDNSDAEFTLNNAAAWSSSTNSLPHYGGSYYHTNGNNVEPLANNWVQWKPSLPSAGVYNVYAWWTCVEASRDDTVYYTVYHNSTSSTAGPHDQSDLDNQGKWNILGTYTFTDDDTEYVRLTPDIEGSSTYSADAVKFVVAGAGGAAISVKNAHYFAVDDIDGDDTHDSGESVYLVNFVDSDTNGSLDSREYYIFNDADGDDNVEDSELLSVPVSEVPGSVIGNKYDENGDVVGTFSDAEALQNWANWFSFYRKRELTGKAAVAAAIDDLDYCYVGYYTINAGLRQSVLPLRVSVNYTVIDNLDAGYTESGSWSESSADNEYKASSRATGVSGDYAQWTPTLSDTDTYEVFVWYEDWWWTRDTNALYTIHHSGGDTNVRVNQQNNTSQWVSIGTYSFDAGTSGYVRVTRDSSSTGWSTSADAVKFVASNASGAVVDETDSLLSSLYSVDSAGGTPLRNALLSVGQYLDVDNDPSEGGLGASPFSSEENGGACQQAFTIIMTDGYWNGTLSTAVDNQDSDSPTNDFDGAPFADTHSNTLADIAMKYYKEDLADNISDLVPTSACERATMSNSTAPMHQHMVTYSVSFGVTGLINPDLYPTCPTSSTTIPWTEPVAWTNTTVDDVYHASVNGRGLYFSASDPQELVSSLEDLAADITARKSSGSSVAVNSEELNTGSVVYQAIYQPGSWKGTVLAYNANANPSVGQELFDWQNPAWDASDKLFDNINWSDRKVVTFNPDTEAGVEFSATNLTTGQQTLLGPDYLNVIDWIKGKYISGFRLRDRGFDPVRTFSTDTGQQAPVIGDIVHAAPILINDTLFVGSNDGMMHAINAITGIERFCYIPNLVYDNFHDESDVSKSFYNPGYAHKYFVDGTPTYSENVDPDDGSDDLFTYLVGGLGKGGKGYYCLDVTQADTLTSSSSIDAVKAIVKWEYPLNTGDDPDMGYSFSNPVIVKSNITTTNDTGKKKWVVIFGNGYDSTNGNAVLYIRNIDGSHLAKIDTGAGGCNGLSSVAVTDTNGDSLADYVYAGDLKGNMWKFDISSDSTGNWDVAYEDSGSVKQPLITVPNTSITSKPSVIWHTYLDREETTLSCTNKEVSGFMVFFGTGRFLNEDDRDNTDSQYMVGAWDYGDDADDREFLGNFNESGSPQLSNQGTGVTLLEQTTIFNDFRDVTVDGETVSMKLRVLTDNTPDWTIQCDTETTQEADPAANAGWFFKLPDSGERVIQDVIWRDGRLIYLTFTPSSNVCTGGGSSILHEVDPNSGGRLSYSALDINSDMALNDGDLINVDGVDYEVSAMGRPYMLHLPAFLDIPDQPVEAKLHSTSIGTVETIFEAKGGDSDAGYYWRLLQN